MPFLAFYLMVHKGKAVTVGQAQSVPSIQVLSPLVLETLKDQAFRWVTRRTVHVHRVTQIHTSSG